MGRRRWEIAMLDVRSLRPDNAPGAAVTRISAAEFGPLTRFRAAVAHALVARRSRRAEAVLRANAPLWALIEAYARNSAVTGVSYGDYLTLYEEVRRRRPTEILECGTGISTVVLAYAQLENEREGAPPGRVTSMEDVPHWHAVARQCLPAQLAGRVDLVLSPKRDGFYKCFRGVEYAAIPDRPYDFVFSDGPDRHSPVNGDKLFNLDFITVVRRSERPVFGIVDDHYLTFYVLQKVFGLRRARYSVARKLMLVGPVTRADVRILQKEPFLRDLRLLRPTELHLRMGVDR
ncbi:MAG: class I SAM-dependent methyltransferase [Alphaproteobacteria bacterium]